MGLDVAMGLLVIVTAIRGWMRGFVLQALRFAGLVACVYVAAPLRDEIKPYAVDYLPTMSPDVVDRLLWWSAAVLAYFVIVGVGTAVVRMSRRQPLGLEEPRRGDQFAGLGLGVVKGLVVASFVLAGMGRYARPIFANISWAEEETRSSQAWSLHQQYQPAEVIWTSPPVQNFVDVVRKMGFRPATESTEATEETPVKTASRTPTLIVPESGGEGATSPDLEDVDQETRRLLERIDREIARIGAK